jgi:colanic acid/amylovoran biosynthesis protein
MSSSLSPLGANMPLKIAIAGVTGFRNRGVEALVRPTVEQILTRFPNAEIQIATRSVDYDQKRLRHSRIAYVEDALLKCGHWVPPSAPVSIHRPLWKRAVWKAVRTLGLSKSNPQIRAEVAEMPFDSPDLLIITGGDIYSSDYGTNSLRHFLHPVEWAQSRNIPCILLAHSIGVFKGADDISIWKRVESAASRITLRDSLTGKYLKEELGADSRLYEVTADTAFLLKSDPAVASRQLSFATGPTVALSISAGICEWTGGNYEQHLQTWVQLVRMILEQWGAKVAIIPHVQEPHSDDRIVSSEVFRALGYDPRVRVFSEDLSAAEYKGIIENCEMVIAERMHAAIAGLSTGVCTVPIGYSIKAKGITEMVLESSQIDADSLVMPLEFFIDFNRSAERLTAIWKDRFLYRDAIRSSADKLRVDVMRNFEVIEALLNRGRRE